MATELDSIVEAYEEARAAGAPTDLRRFLPSAESESYQEVALELMRVDLEYRWQNGEQRGLDTYLSEYGDVLRDRAALTALAFEEFRLREAAGQGVNPDDYAARYGIDTSDWVTDNSATRAAEFPRVGNQLLGFQLLRELGRGTFGRVYLAEQADLAHRRVALKVTREITAEPERLAQLQHTHIVPIYSVHRHGALQVLCMPYYGDRTLRDWLWDRREARDAPSRGARVDTEDARRADTIAGDNKTATDPSYVAQSQPEIQTLDVRGDRVSESLRIMLGVARGLAHAHQRGIVHRDLKPANVLLREDGVPLILDFNLATTVDEIVVSGVGGTLPYMSPEQLLSLENGKPVDACSDIYACGVLLVEMLTGRRPFPEVDRGPRAWRAAREQRLRGYQDAESLSRGSSVDVASIVQKCLAPDLEDRYQTGAELACDLERHLNHLPLRYAANRSQFERLRKWSRRHPRLGSASGVATIAAVLLLAAAGLIFARARQVAHIDAERARETYLRNVPEVRATLTTPNLDTQLANDAIANAEELLRPYVRETEDWRRSDRIALLTIPERRELLSDLDSTQRELTLAKARLAKPLTLSTSPSAVTSESADDELTLREVTARHLALGEYVAAAESAERWVRQVPHDFEANFLLGNALVGCGRADDAERCYSICIALSPNSWFAWFQRGVCQLELQRYAAAETDFARVLYTRPGIASALVNRAVALERLGDLPGALDSLAKAIATGEAPTRAYLMRSRLYARQGRMDEAKVDRELGLKATPTDSQSWVARGVARLSESPKAAYQDFQSALKRFPFDANAWQNSAHVLSERLNRPQEAIDALTQLLKFRPRDADALAGRAVLYARLGQSDAALADVARLEKATRTAVHHYQAACVFALLSAKNTEHQAGSLQSLAEACRQDAAFGALAKEDADLAALHDNVEFQRIIDAAQTLRAASDVSTAEQ